MMCTSKSFTFLSNFWGSHHKNRLFCLYNLFLPFYDRFLSAECFTIRTTIKAIIAKTGIAKNHNSL